MARSKGEGSIYYIEKRKKWSAQYTITVGDKQVRKTVYGNTKREVADKLLDLRVQMKDIDLIKEHGMSIIQIMKDIRDNKLHEEKYLKEKMEDFYGIKRNESITNSSANEYENGRTSQKANIFRRTNTEIKKNRKVNGFNNGKYKKIYKRIKCKNV